MAAMVGSPTFIFRVSGFPTVTAIWIFPSNPRSCQKRDHAVYTTELPIDSLSEVDSLPGHSQNKPSTMATEEQVLSSAEPNRRFDISRAPNLPKENPRQVRKLIKAAVVAIPDQCGCPKRPYHLDSDENLDICRPGHGTLWEEQPILCREVRRAPRETKGSKCLKGRLFRLQVRPSSKFLETNQPPPNKSSHIRPWRPQPYHHHFVQNQTTIPLSPL